MNISNESILFLTACVHPNGMIDTKLQDGDIRLKQYLEAIDFYLQHTTLKILVVENTEVDIGSFYNEEIGMDRMECLTFNGNDFDKKLGKGYGEGLIIDYAFKHSQFIKCCRFIIKVSGRHKVLNINKLIFLSEPFLNRNENLIVCEVSKKKRFAKSDFFISAKSFYISFLIADLKRVNDSQSIWFEHVLFDCIERALKNSFQFLFLPLTLNQSGQSGTFGELMKKPRFRRHVRFFCTMLMYKMNILRV